MNNGDDLTATLAALEALEAGLHRGLRPVTVARGLAQQRAGAVVEVRDEGGTVAARVRSSGGDSHYGVFITYGASPRDWAARCDCPYESEDVCKHIIAVVRELVESVGGPAPEEPETDAPEVAPLTAGEGGRVDPEELQRWARTYGVLPLLDDLAVRAMVPADGGRASSVAQLWHSCARDTTVGQLASALRPFRGGSTALDGSLPVLRAAARQHLQARAQVTARSRTLSADWLASLDPPTEEAARAAWDRLDALRETLEPEARWLSPQERRTDRVSLRAAEGQLYLVATGRSGCKDSFGTSTAQVRAGWAEEPAAVTCGCPTPAGCAVALRAVHAALELLSTSSRDPLSPEWLEVATTAPWRRAVQRLDDLLDQTEARQPGDERELGWILQWEGGLKLSPALVRPYKNGKGWSSNPIGVHEVLEFVRGPQASADSSAAELLSLHTGGNAYDLGRVAILRALRELVGHPRVLAREGKKGPLTPLRVGRGRLALALERDAEGAVRLELDIEGQRLALDAAGGRLEKWRAGSHYLHADLAGGRCVVCHIEPALARLVHGLSAHAQAMPAAAAVEVARRIPRLAEATELKLGEQFRGEAVAPDSALVVRMSLERDRSLEVRLAIQPLREGAALVPGEGAKELIGVRDGEVVHCPRNLNAEREAVVAVAESLGLSLGAVEPALAPYGWRLDRLDDALELVGRVGALAPAVARVEWAETRRLAVLPTDGLDHLTMKAESRNDWFKLSGQLMVGQVSVPLGALLRALRAGKRYVAVEDDQFVRLDEAIRTALGPVAEAAEAGDRLSRFAVATLEALGELEEAGVELDAPAEWLAVRREIDEAATLKPELPPGFTGELRPYQRDGYDWLCRLAHWGAGACLADDMGLGKTIQALALLAARAHLGPALVVAPTSIGFNWVRECERFAPGLNPVAFRSKGDLGRLENLGPATVLITSYDLVVRHAEALGPTRFSTLVLDEAQAVKNPGTRRARAVHGLDAGFRLALTGTPIENRVAELWSLFRAITPGLLGSKKGFRERFIQPIERDGDTERRALLATLVRPFILRRLKSEVARELPPRTEIDLRVQLSTAERRLYEEVREAALADLAGKTDESPQQRGFRVLAALTRLRQLACHPRLVHPRSKAKSAKIEALVELLLELRDEAHRVLVFSQFTSLLALARESLEAAGLNCLQLDGSTPSARRRALVDAFQGGEGDVFLLSVKAGGTGLNLTGADYVVHLDPWWNPAVEDQATDRAHRIGQTRPVTVYRLVAENTVEDQILQLHADKRELAAALLDGTAGGQALSTEELSRILSAVQSPDTFEEPTSAVTRALTGG